MQVISTIYNLYNPSLCHPWGFSQSVLVLAEFLMPNVSMCLICPRKLFSPAQIHAKSQGVGPHIGQSFTCAISIHQAPTTCLLQLHLRGIPHGWEFFTSRSLRSAWHKYLYSFCQYCFCVTEGLSMSGLWLHNQTQWAMWSYKTKPYFMQSFFASNCAKLLQTKLFKTQNQYLLPPCFIDEGSNFRDRLRNLLKRRVTMSHSLDWQSGLLVFVPGRLPPPCTPYPTPPPLFTLPSPGLPSIPQCLCLSLPSSLITF